MGAVQKIGNFLGVKKFSDALASTGRILGGEVSEDIASQALSDDSLLKISYAMKNESNPEKKLQLKQLVQSQLDAGRITEDQIDPGLKLSPKEIVGSGANVVLNTFIPGALKGGKVAVLAKNAALGAGFGAASGLEKDRSVKGVLGSATAGAITGAAIGGVGMLAKVGKDFLSKITPEWIMSKAVKPALEDLKKNVKYGSDTLGKELLDEGVKGSPKKLLETAKNRVDDFENQLQTILTSPGLEDARITKLKLLPYIKDLMEQKAGTPGMSGDVQRIKNIFDSLPDALTISDANVMKRRIYNELKSPAYKLDAKLGTKAAVLKQIANGLKTEIENEVGGTVVKDINQKLSIYGRLENAMVDQLAREMRNNGVGLTDAILLAGGDTTSWLALLRHLGQGLGTYSAQGLKKTGEILESKAVQGVKDQIIKRGMLNLP